MILKASKLVAKVVQNASISSIIVQSTVLSALRTMDRRNGSNKIRITSNDNNKLQSESVELSELILLSLSLSLVLGARNLARKDLFRKLILKIVLFSLRFGESRVFFSHPNSCKIRSHFRRLGRLFVCLNRLIT